MEANGGDALTIQGPLTLCGRAAGVDDRAFNGSLAHLMVFDAALEASDVQARVCRGLSACLYPHVCRLAYELNQQR
jgi:hypothetical protein